MALYSARWGGTINSVYTTDSPIDEWVCSLSVLGPAWNTTTAQSIATEVGNYAVIVRARISKRIRFDYCKVNEYDVATGLQITDPTWTDPTWGAPFFGTATITNPRPVTVSSRISLDNATRNRKAKGGFYLPGVDDTIG